MGVALGGASPISQGGPKPCPGSAWSFSAMCVVSTNTVPVPHKPSMITMTKAASISVKRDGRFMPLKCLHSPSSSLVIELGEAVADAVYHVDVAGVVGVVFDFAPQILVMCINGPFVALEAVIVHALDELGPGEW